MKSTIKTNNNIHNGFDDASLQLAFESVLPHDLLQNGDQSNEHSTENNVLLNGSPSIRQVKYIPANQFVHIKPPPINTQKIYVKQQNGNESYTLGVKSISTSDIPALQNRLTAVKNEDLSNQMEENESAAESDSNMDINIFDIPILFADNDGNILESQNGNETPKRATTPEPEPEPETESDPNPQTHNRSKTIEILSEEIITGTIIGKHKFFSHQFWHFLNSSVLINASFFSRKWISI